MSIGGGACQTGLRSALVWGGGGGGGGSGASKDLHYYIRNSIVHIVLRCSESDN